MREQTITNVFEIVNKENERKVKLEKFTKKSLEGGY